MVAMKAQTVLVTSLVVEPDSPAVRALRDEGYDVAFDYWHEGRDEEELISAIGGVQAVVASVDPFSRRVLESTTALRVIARTGVGVDSIDVETATKRGVIVATAPGVLDDTVADYTFAMLLAVSRKLVENQQQVRAARWQRVIGHDISNKTIGIIGMGAIGKQVALRATGFRMRILAHDVVQDELFAREHGILYVPLEQLLRESDFVTLHLPLTRTTKNLLDERRLRLMKASAYLINTSRGAIVDETALVAALQARQIAGAALDVFEQEPPWGSQLLRLPNVLVSPHAAAMSKESQDAVAKMACENVTRVLSGRQALHTVNPEAYGRWRS